jgi:hypothetical protein
MVQQQYYSLGALAKRDAGDPFAKPTAPATAVAAPTEQPLPMAASYAVALVKALDAHAA